MSKFVRIAPRFQVNDLDKALSFYRDLGFEIEPYDEGLAFVKADGFDFHVHHDTEAGRSRQVWWIEVKGIDVLYERCQKISARVNSVIRSQPWGFREFNINDPFGNLLIFAEREN